MGRDLMPIPHQSLGKLWVLLKGHCDGVGGEVPSEFLEETDQSPGGGAAAVLEILLRVQVSGPFLVAARSAFFP